MLSVALLCCLALLGGAHGASVPDPEPYEEEPHLDDGDDNIKDMLAHLEGEMNQLVSKYMHLSEEFEDKVHDREAAQTKASNLKLRMAKGDHVCKKGFFRCASAEDQCVSDMLVCDGEKDCHDGSDEDEHVCTLPFSVGDTWKFHRVYDWCSSMSPERAYGEVIAIDVNPWNSAATTVTARFHFLSQDRFGKSDKIFTFTGFYKYARQEIVWFASEGVINGPAFDGGVDYTYYITFDDDSYYMTLRGFRAEKQCCLWVESEEIEIDELE